MKTEDDTTQALPKLTQAGEGGPCSEMVLDSPLPSVGGSEMQSLCTDSTCALAAKLLTCLY